MGKYVTDDAWERWARGVAKDFQRKEAEALAKEMREQPLLYIESEQPKVDFMSCNLLWVNDLFLLVDRIDERISNERILHAKIAYVSRGENEEAIKKCNETIDKYKKYKEAIIKKIEAILDTLIEDKE